MFPSMSSFNSTHTDGHQMSIGRRVNVLTCN